MFFSASYWESGWWRCPGSASGSRTAWYRAGPNCSACCSTALCAAPSRGWASSISGWACGKRCTIATTYRAHPPTTTETRMKETNKKAEPAPAPALAPPELEPAALAYLNPEFLNSPDGRMLRILAEYAEPLSRFRHEKIQDTVVFFGSARFGGLDDAQEKLSALQAPGSSAPVASANQAGAQASGELQASLKRADTRVQIGKRRVGKECRSRWSPY